MRCRRGEGGSPCIVGRDHDDRMAMA